MHTESVFAPGSLARAVVERPGFLILLAPGGLFGIAVHVEELLDPGAEDRRDLGGEPAPVSTPVRSGDGVSPEGRLHLIPTPPRLCVQEHALIIMKHRMVSIYF